MRKPRVTEYVAIDGRMVVWCVWDGNVMDVRIAAKSPLTGAWLLDSCDGRQYPRHATLRGARQCLIGGNGHRYRGHSNVTTVHPINVSSVEWLARASGSSTAYATAR